ncbi:MAG: hypothetical protein J7J86_09625 [Bacteroidales bacterium]|nr:hypothetical protein [Bacteroidales bacterium]
MKKFFTILILFFIFYLIPTQTKGEMVIDIAGHARLESMGNSYYHLYCEPPYDILCVRLYLNNNGIWGVIFNDGGSAIPINNDFELTENGGLFYTTID